MPEREHAAESEQQVEGAREHCEAQQLHHEDGVDAEKRSAEREQACDEIEHVRGTHTSIPYRKGPRVVRSVRLP